MVSFRSFRFVVSGFRTCLAKVIRERFVMINGLRADSYCKAHTIQIIKLIHLPLQICCHFYVFYT